MLRAEVHWDLCRACDPCSARPACKTKAVVKLDPDEPAVIDLSRCSGCGDCLPARTRPLSCGAPMCQSSVVRSLILLDADNFEPVVFAAPQPVAVVFWGPDCGPCHVLAPTLERAVDAYGDRVTFAALDTAIAPQVAARFGVRAIPYLLFSARGEVCCHFLGVIPWAFLRDKLEHAPTLSTR